MALAWTIALLACVLFAGGLLAWHVGRREARHTAAQAVIERQLAQRRRVVADGPRPAQRQRQAVRLWRGPQGWNSLMLCAGIAPTPGFYLRSAVVCLAIVILAALWGGGLAAAVALALAMVGGYFLVWLKAERRRRKMIAQLPEFLDMVVRMMTVGNSMGAAFQAASVKTNAPLLEVMERVASLSRTGRDLDVSLRQVSRQYRLHELYLVAAVVGVAQRFGGRSDHVLARMAAFMRDLSQARQELVALSAEVRLSAWVLALLPLVIGAFILMFNTELFLGMWDDHIGWRLLIGAFGLQVLGSYWLYRLARQI